MLIVRVASRAHSLDLKTVNLTVGENGKIWQKPTESNNVRRKQSEFDEKHEVTSYKLQVCNLQPVPVGASSIRTFDSRIKFDDQTLIISRMHDSEIKKQSNHFQTFSKF